VALYTADKLVGPCERINRPCAVQGCSGVKRSGWELPSGWLASLGASAGKGDRDPVTPCSTRSAPLHARVVTITSSKPSTSSPPQAFGNSLPSVASFHKGAPCGVAALRLAVITVG
jgi:hypothetical protein